MAEAEKPRSQSTRACLKATETKAKLENRRPRSPNGTPIARTEHKDNPETTGGNIVRKSRSFTDPDSFGSLKIYGAEGLFSLASTFKQPNLSRVNNNNCTTMERPMFISSENITSKQSVSSLKANFEQGPGFIESSLQQHMAEFTNPLHHKESRPRLRDGASGSVKAVKPPVAPKPQSPAKKTEPLKITESPSKKAEPPAKKTESPDERIESPAKKNESPKITESPSKKPEPPVKKTESPAKRIESPQNITSDLDNIRNGKPLLYEELPPTQPESKEHCSSDEEDGLYSKVVHHNNIKPMPMNPPPRRPFNSNVTNVCKQQDENSVAEQDAEKEIESEKLSEIPIYAKVNKQKSKTLDHIEETRIIMKTRSKSEPRSKNISIQTPEKQSEVSAMREETPSMDSGDNMKEDDSDFDDNDEPWDSDEFDGESDFDENEDLDSTSLSQNKQEDDMVFPDEKSKKLYNIAKEILTTERGYVKRLHLLDQVFCFRLKNECLDHGHIPPEVLQDVFSNISAIHTLHKDFFLPKLEERMSEWSTNNRVGDILKTLAPFLKLYTAYIANFDKSSETLATWSKKSPKFSSVIEDIQKSSECENLTLGHHMLEPIQRVPRYKLLLRDYLSKLPEDSPDYKNCQDAMGIISEAAAHANDSMKKMERFEKLLELQDRLSLEDDIDVIAASRQFIMEGDLTKVAARSSTGHQERTLLLFNDLLLCCAKLPGTNKLKVKVKMDMDGMEVGDPDEDEDVVLCNTFRVTSKQKVIDFSASSEEDKDKWTTALKEAIEELIRKRDSYKRGIQIKPISECDLGKKAPAWVRDESTTMCMLCDAMFTLTRRRHHCRSCGRIFCHACCHFKAALEYAGGKQSRVCQSCYEIIVKGAKRSLIKKKVEEEKSLDIRKISGQTKVLISGYLNYNRGSEKNWVKRWCVLSDNFVFYCYKAKKDTKAAFSIPLPGYVVGKPNRLADDIDKELAFKIHHKNVVVYFFEADGKELLERWIHNLSYAVKAERIPEVEEESTSEEADEARRSSMP